MSNLVSAFKGVRDVKSHSEIEILEALRRIKEGINKEVVINAREAYGTPAYSDLKSFLPSYKFSGLFSGASDSSITSHTGFICLDFDKFETKQDLEAFRATIEASEYTYANFLSPSGMGFKTLIQIPKSIEDHKFHFDALQEMYISEEWDSKVKNIGRHCFHSYDPDLYLNEDSTLFTKKAGVENYMMAQSRPLITIKSSNDIIQRLDKWFAKHWDAGARNNSIYRLANAHNCYGIPESESLSHILSSFEGAVGSDGSGLKTSEITHTVKSAYLRSERFGTVGFEDKDVVSSTRTKLRQGQAIPDVKKQLMETRTKIESDIIVSQAKSQTETHTFWKVTQTEKGERIEHLPKDLKEFIQSRGYFRFKDSKLKYVFVKIENNFIEITNAEDIKSCVLDYLENDFSEAYDYFVNRTGLFKEDFLSFLDPIDVEFIKDNAHSANLFYRNCLLNISKDSTEQLNYVDFGYVWKDQIIDRDFEEGDSDGDYKQFISNVSQSLNEDGVKTFDSERYNSFRSTIGYLLHNFKSDHESPCVILYDEVISDNPQGSTGKSIFFEALKKLKHVEKADGKSFDPQKDFAYQKITKATQIFYVDDAKEGIKFEDLFSIITNGISVNRKNKDEFFISQEDAPKIAMTSNYIIKGSGQSYERRRFEIEFHPHYNNINTPNKEFGHNLFSGWDTAEWGLFDNFIVECIQFFLTHGLTKYEQINIAEKRAVKNIGNELIEWISEDKENFINETHKNKDLHARFLGETSADKRFWSQTQFVRKLRAYGEVLIKSNEIDEVRAKKYNNVNTTEFFCKAMLTKDEQNECPI